jgi:hypothetical protein
MAPGTATNRGDEMEKPSLKEIAAKPYFGQAAAAIREHYDPHWGLFENGGPRTYEVTIRYTVRTEEIEVYEIEAASEEEAKAIAEDRFDKEHAFGDVEIDEIEVEGDDD